MGVSDRGATALAGGAVCWHDQGGELKVLLVHRPKYDDWSWPKGGAASGEPLPVTAVREVGEETGLKVQLGIPLSSANYELTDGRSKVVSLWASRISNPKLPPPPRPREVDITRWATVKEASKMLTRRADRVQLHEVEQAWQSGSLNTFPVIILRHAYAYPRRNFAGQDGNRPLVGAGQRQATSLRKLLNAWAPTRIVTSPAKRCLDTVEPYARDCGVKVKVKRGLGEDEHFSSPAKAAKTFAKAIARQEPTVLCSHRPVLPTLFEAMLELCDESVASLVPTVDPWLEPGEAVIAQVAKATGRVVSVERHLAPHLPR